MSSRGTWVLQISRRKEQWILIHMFNIQWADQKMYPYYVLPLKWAPLNCKQCSLCALHPCCKGSCLDLAVDVGAFSSWLLLLVVYQACTWVCHSIHTVRLCVFLSFILSLALAWGHQGVMWGVLSGIDGKLPFDSELLQQQHSGHTKRLWWHV